MAIVRWNPAKDLLNMEREFNRLFSSIYKDFGRGMGEENANNELENAVWMPLTDIKEDKNQYILMLDLPGVSKNDVKISYENGRLNISGERKQEKESNDSKFYRIERNYGKYFRSFNLPEKIKEDQISASFKDGQLSITIPKAEESKPKEISINVS